MSVRSFVLMFLAGLLLQIGCGTSVDEQVPAVSAAEDGQSAAADDADQRRGRRAADSDQNADQAEVDIVGEYRYGSELSGGGTEGGVVVIERLGDAYAITMKPNRGTQYSGIAIRTEDHLAVCYSFPGLGERGVGSFVIGSDGSLTGQWAVLGRDGKLLDDKWTKSE